VRRRRGGVDALNPALGGEGKGSGNGRERREEVGAGGHG
jgi:hypothetical protein